LTVNDPDGAGQNNQRQQTHDDPVPKT
jgi:hypothetical protein